MHVDCVGRGVETKDKVVNIDIVADVLGAGILRVGEVVANGGLEQERAADHTKGYAAEPVDREVLVQRGGIGRVLEPEKPRGITISRMEADLKKGLFDVGE